jgi:hypothetical protein
MSEPVVVTERHGNVALVRLNRPAARNAMNAELAQATINLSKDNVIFGVRSVGTDGYRSPAVFPFRA